MHFNSHGRIDAGPAHAAHRRKKWGRSLAAMAALTSLAVGGSLGVFPIGQSRAVEADEFTTYAVATNAPESGVQVASAGEADASQSDQSGATPVEATPESGAMSASGSTAPAAPEVNAEATDDDDSNSVGSELTDEGSSTLAGLGASPRARAPRAGELPAVFATGGSGSYTSSIQWLQWAPFSDFLNPDGSRKDKPNVPVLNYGQQRVFSNVRDLGDAGSLITNCTLDNLDLISQKNQQGEAHPSSWKGPLVATIPGTWAGDALDSLYNVGGPGVWKDGSLFWHSGLTYPQDYTNKNEMVIGLANGYAYNGSGGPGTGQDARVSFNLSCTAKLVVNGSEKPVQVRGLVFADAEASSDRTPYGNSNTTVTADSVGAREDEWIQAEVPAGTKWRLLDRLRSENCNGVTTNAIISSNNTKLRLMPSGEECVYQGGSYAHPNGLGGPDAVVFMEGATSAKITMQGAGYSAVALGLIISTDFGDAPYSYGYAGSLFEPKWEQGNISWNKGTAAIGSDRKIDLFDGIDPATLIADEAAPSLGHKIDAEGMQRFSDGADGDDKDGFSNDEDAIDANDLHIETVPGGTHKQTVVCGGTGKAAGWIDWNHNGVFDEATEKSDEVECVAGKATLTWDVPSDVVRSVTGEEGSQNDTYMRLRITKDDGGNGQHATGITTTGEVEDYRVAVRIPTLQLVKKVDGKYASAEVSALSTDQWTLTGRNNSAPAGFAIVSGRTDTGVKNVVNGNYALSETSSHADADGYEASTWTCRETPGTIAAVGSPYTSSVKSQNPGVGTVTVKNTDRVTCEVTNTTKPGTISWDKVDADGTSLLAGTAWKLIGPAVPAGTIVSDCAAATCPVGPYKDQDPAAGKFKLTGLSWGTYSIVEESVPAGYHKLTDTFTFPTVGPLHLESRLAKLDGKVTDAGAIINKRLTGSVTWKKVDADNKEALSGSEWNLTGGSGLPLGGVTIVDCVANSADQCPKAPNATYYDSDPTAGSFKVVGIDWATDQYVLKESKAPAGYQLSQEEHKFSITPKALHYTFGTAFENEKQGVPDLPLTGGMSADAFIFGGVGVLVVGAIAMAVVGRNRKKQAM